MAALDRAVLGDIERLKARRDFAAGEHLDVELATRHRADALDSTSAPP